VLTGVQPDTSLIVGGRRVTDDVQRALRDVAPAVVIYVAIRVAGLVALLLFGRARGVDGFSRLQMYDAPRLLGIAIRGYDPLGPDDEFGRSIHSNIAFFPLYPLSVRLVAGVPGVGVTAAGFAVTAVTGLAAAIALDRLSRRLVALSPGAGAKTAGSSGIVVPAVEDDDAVKALRAQQARLARRARTAGLVLVALWACWPHSAVLAMPYTEALFVALAAWSLVALLDGRWVTAGVLSLLAGATRPMGTALAVAVLVAAAVATARALRSERRFPGPPLIAAALAPLGFLGYWAWLWTRTGRGDAWFWVQANEWHSTFDGGRFTIDAVVASFIRHQALVLVVCAAAVVASVILLAALVVQRPPLPILIYTALATYTVVGAAGYSNSKARFLLGAFTLLVPLARLLARIPVPVLVVLLGGLAGLSAWYNAYVLVAWPYSP
jgi:hypothetical protein